MRPLGRTRREATANGESRMGLYPLDLPICPKRMERRSAAGPLAPEGEGQGEGPCGREIGSCSLFAVRYSRFEVRRCRSADIWDGGTSWSV